MATVGRCVAGILAGCGVNVMFLELITSRDASSGALITLSQFLFVSLWSLSENLSVSGAFFLKPRQIPLWFHLFITVNFFTVSLLNNVALSFNIAMPLHMVFRSSSLAASLLLGLCAFGKAYEPHQTRGVLLVTAGIITATLAEAQATKQSSLADCCDSSNGPAAAATAAAAAAVGAAVEAAGESADPDSDRFEVWLIGLGMLTVALFASAALGHFQEWAYSTYGRHSGELKFYAHTLALPGFWLLQRQSITASMAAWNDSEPLAEALPHLGLGPAAALLAPDPLGRVPVLWVLLLGNVLSQLLCISCVYKLTAISSTLTCTLTVTLRKFLSILVSVAYFHNPFSPMHWVGTALVFAGVAFYSGLHLSDSKQTTTTATKRPKTD